MLQDFDRPQYALQATFSGWVCGNWTTWCACVVRLSRAENSINAENSSFFAKERVEEKPANNIKPLSTSTARRKHICSSPLPQTRPTFLCSRLTNKIRRTNLSFNNNSQNPPNQHESHNHCENRRASRSPVQTSLPVKHLGPRSIGPRLEGLQLDAVPRANHQASEAAETPAVEG